MRTPITYWKEAGLKKPSVARISKSMNLTKNKFLNKKGEIYNEDRRTIIERFKEFINQQE